VNRTVYEISNSNLDVYLLVTNISQTLMCLCHMSVAKLEHQNILIKECSQKRNLSKSIYRISNTHVSPSLLYVSDVINPGILASVIC